MCFFPDQPTGASRAYLNSYLKRLPKKRASLLLGSCRRLEKEKQGGGRRRRLVEPKLQLHHAPGGHPSPLTRCSSRKKSRHRRAQQRWCLCREGGGIAWPSSKDCPWWPARQNWSTKPKDWSCHWRVCGCFSRVGFCSGRQDPYPQSSITFGLTRRSPGHKTITASAFDGTLPE